MGGPGHLLLKKGLKENLMALSKEFFITSLWGDRAVVYPFEAWLEIEEQLRNRGIGREVF